MSFLSLFLAVLACGPTALAAANETPPAANVAIDPAAAHAPTKERILEMIGRAVMDEILVWPETPPGSKVPQEYSRYYIDKSKLIILYVRPFTPAQEGWTRLIYILWPYGEIYRGVSWDEQYAYLNDAEDFVQKGFLPCCRDSCTMIENYETEWVLEFKQKAIVHEVMLDFEERDAARTRELERNRLCAEYRLHRE